MTKLVVLSPAERRRFDSPPNLTGDESSIYFSLPPDVAKIIDRLRTPTNKVGFMLQLAYFKSQSKFFTYDQFKPSDIDYCWQNKIEVPSHNQLALIITESFNQNKTHLVNQVTKFLSNNEDKALLLLMTTENDTEEKQLKKPTITLLRHVNQSLQPSDIKENVEVLELVKQHFYQLKNLIEHLPLSDNTTEYFATSRLVIEAITEIVQSPMLSEKQKLTEIELKLADYHQQQDEQAREQTQRKRND